MAYVPWIDTMMMCVLTVVSLRRLFVSRNTFTCLFCCSLPEEKHSSCDFVLFLIFRCWLGWAARLGDRFQTGFEQDAHTHTHIHTHKKKKQGFLLLHLFVWSSPKYPISLARVGKGAGEWYSRAEKMMYEDEG